MSRQKFLVRGGAQWQPLPTPVTSVTNTGFGKVAINVNGVTRSLPPNGCQKFVGPQSVYVVSEQPRGEVTCELPE